MYSSQFIYPCVYSSEFNEERCCDVLKNILYIKCINSLDTNEKCLELYNKILYMKCEYDKISSE